MKGYRAKDGFHIILENDESLALISVISEGVKGVRQWDIKEPLKSQCIEEAEVLDDKFATIFIADNYRKTSKVNPVVARFTKPLKCRKLDFGGAFATETSQESTDKSPKENATK